MTDLANIAAATAARYKETATDRGAGYTNGPRFHCHLSKYLQGAPGQAGYDMRADGFSAVSAASARANALANLNNQRGHRYGFGSVRSKGINDGSAHTDNVT
jgi:hypothetical protein